ncbi:peptidoglycan recognition protein [Streptomyces sp. NPDC047725]|uniref:peptidoglycan recognition protein family protein n=1 Tax=Streptomyces sp. NPDC047725 TaxID=3365487 RepID=UPI0037235949
MRGYLASSIGVTCAAALALPLAAAPTTATATTKRASPAQGSGPAPAEAHVPGGTQSLPLAPLAGDRAGAAQQGVPRRGTRHFSLVGVVWDDAVAELHGRVQVRTRSAVTGAWSGWQDLETHNAEHAADPGAPEGPSDRVRGATAPLWVGESDGVEVRVRAAEETGDKGAVPAVTPLPAGLRLELVDPGKGAPPRPGTGAAAPGAGDRTALTPESDPASAANAGLAPLGATEIPALTRDRTESGLLALGGALTGHQRTTPRVGPRPGIVTRRGWGANERLREKKFVYTRTVKAAFVHHTSTGNNYTCSQAPSVIRSIQRYHVGSMGWRDIGYNFLVDRCGKIYEGRAGGVEKAVLGAHTMGFNADSTGIAVLGTYDSEKPSPAAVKAVARLTAWKLGLHGVNPRGKTYLKSGGGNLYRKGRNVRLNVISGHRDGFATSCPGKQLYGKLVTARSSAAKYQGR